MHTIIPMVSLVNGNNHSGEIFTVQDSAAVQISVSVAFLSGDQVVLNDSLEDIDIVITEGASYLKNGSSLEIVSD